MAQERAAAEAAQEQTLQEREREEKQALRETLKRAALEERLQLASARRVEKERHLHAAVAQRLALEAQTAETVRLRDTADAERSTLSVERAARMASRPAHAKGALPYAVAGLLAAVLAAGSFYVTQLAPQSVPPQAAPAAAPARANATPVPMLRMDRELSSLDAVVLPSPGASATPER